MVLLKSPGPLTRMPGRRQLRLSAVVLSLAMATLFITSGTASGENQPPQAPGTAQPARVPVALRVTPLPGLMAGDANIDGRTNIVDAMFVAQHTVGLRSLDVDQLKTADTNGDGLVNIIDAMHIAQYSVDPTGAGGVLFKPLYDESYHEGLFDPLTYPY